MTAPFLKWPGGKSLLVEQIDAALGGPCSGVYVEPFLGGGSVFLHRASVGLVTRALLADGNPRLIGLWRSLRDLGALEAALDTLPWGADWLGAYHPIRDAFNRDGQDPTMQAARFVWLNRACFNGLYRESGRGEFNSPPGDYATIAPPLDALRAAAEIVARPDVRLDRRHVRWTLDVHPLGPGDQVYADPPYHDPGAFVTYSGGWTRLDQDELMFRLRGIAEKGTRVVVSQPAHLKLIREWQARGFAVGAEIDVHRSIGAKAARRGKVGEVLMVAGG